MGYILVVIVIFLLERYIKLHVEKNYNFGTKEPILEGKIIIQKYHNKGVALNFLEKSATLVKWLTGAMIGVILVFFGILLFKKNNKMLLLGLSMILGGALSNLSDRMEKGYVIDYFNFNFGGKLKNIVFNMADMWIFIGAVLTFISSLIKKK